MPKKRLRKKITQGSGDEIGILFQTLGNARQSLIAQATAKAELEAYKVNEAFFQSAPYAFSLWDGEHGLLDVGPQAVEMFEASSKEYYLEHYSEFWAQYQPCGTLSSELATEYINKTLKEGRVRIEWMHRNKKGEEFLTDVTLVRIERNDRPVVAAYITDLRPIRRAMEREHEAINRQQLLYDSIPIPASLWNKNYQVFDCNDAMVRFLGLTNKAEALERFYEFSAERQPDGSSSYDRVTHVIDTVLETGQLFRHNWNHLINGESVPVEVTVARVPMSDGYVAACYALDLRPIKEAEARRIKAIEESNRAKSRFLARMSHEIRTPISSILGISEIELQNPKLHHHIEESFAKIHSSAGTLLGIVNDILDLSKIEAGKIEVVEVTYDTASMISDVSYLHLGFIGSKPIKFMMTVDENMPATLKGDSLRIVQIMNNLLSNAFKYTESGTVTLSWDWSGSALTICVRDTGMGMTNAQVNDLHREYTRFHEREFPDIIGTGLGWPIVHSLLHMMGGKAELKSQVNVGTTITVQIPQKQSGQNVLGKDLALRLQKFEESPHTADKKFKFVPEPMPYGRVLVVDDVDANLYVARGLLSFYDLNVETCVSGYEAIEKIKQGNVYDLVFMDQMMSGINGDETLRVIRDMGYSRPIVVLTANTMIGQAEEFIKHGFDGFISKPIQTAHLNAILTKHIRDKQPPEVIEAAKARISAPANFEDASGFLGSAVLIEKLKVSFTRSHKNAFREISDALASGDTKTAHRIAHTLKSSAYLIQETALSDTAKDIEEMLATGKTPTSTQLADLEKHLKNVLEAIGTTEFSPKNKNLDNVAEMFDKLAALLKVRSYNALNSIDELRDLPEAAILVRQVEEFDFAAAIQSLKVLRDILGI
ncbi:MAG: response regulator [Defluviitaleaceae bacterium]|nr:response regulator [Defluviitaleaceae bacterium]